MDTLQMSHNDVLSLLPDRKEESHKGNYGKILLLCGSKGYTGAAALAAMGALRCGAGLVYLGVPESIYAIEATKLLEPIVFPLPDLDGMFSAKAIEELSPIIPNMHAVLIGPGMGASEGTFQLVCWVLQNAKCPVVLDADGINVLCQHKDILRGRTYPTILTPHTGEFDRIYGMKSLDKYSNTISVAKDLGVIMVHKGHHTVITDAQTVYVNPTGNAGMAVGGCGDVLAGIIVSLLGQGIAPLQAAACGVWLHGAAGDICARELGQYGMLPSDMLNALPRLLK